MEKVRVFIVDDHAIVCEGVRQILSMQPDITVVGAANDAEEALKEVKALNPDVVVLDVSMPRLSGLDMIPLMKRALPRSHIVIFSMHQKEAFVQQALRSGAAGYVLKTAPVSDLLEAIRAVHRGEYYLGALLQAEVISAYTKSRQGKPSAHGYDVLSDREQQVLRLVVQGKTTKQIGEILCLSPRTVEKYRATVLHKLNIKDTLELFKYAVRLGIVDHEG